MQKTEGILGTAGAGDNGALGMGEPQQMAPRPELAVRSPMERV